MLTPSRKGERGRNPLRLRPLPYHSNNTFPRITGDESLPSESFNASYARLR